MHKLTRFYLLVCFLILPGFAVAQKKIPSAEAKI